MVPRSLTYTLTFFIGLGLGIGLANGLIHDGEHPSDYDTVSRSDWQSLLSEISAIRRSQTDNTPVSTENNASIKMQQIRRELQALIDQQEKRLSEQVKTSIREGMDVLELNLRRDLANQTAEKSSNHVAPIGEPPSPLNRDFSKEPSPEQIASYQSLQKMLEKDYVKQNFEMTNITGSKEFSELHPMQREQLMSEIYNKINMGELAVQGHSH